MAERIKGITVEINGDTAGLHQSLGNVNKMIRTTQSELQTVEKLLKLDPTNTELLAQKQSLLAKEIGLTGDKLDGLKKAAQEAYTKMQAGEISLQQYQALQAEIIRTTEAQKKYTDKLERMSSASNQLKETISKQKAELSTLKAAYTDVVLEQGENSDAAVALKQKYDQLNEELTQNTDKLNAAESSANKLGQAEQAAQTPLESLKSTISKQKSELEDLKNQYMAVVLEQDENSDAAVALKQKYDQLNEELTQNTDKLNAAESSANKLGQAEQAAQTPLESLKSTISKQKSELEDLKNQYMAVVLEQDENSDAAVALKQKYDQLNEELTQNTDQLNAAESSANKLRQAGQAAQTPLESLKETISKQETELSKLSAEYQNAYLLYGKNSTQAQQLAEKIKTLSDEHQSCTKQLSDMETEAKQLATAEQGLTDRLSSQKQDLSKLKQEYVDATAQYGKHSSEAKSLKSQIEDLSKKIADEETTVKKATESADAFDKSMKNAGDSAKDAGNKVSESEGHFSKFASTLGHGVASGAEIGAKSLAVYTGAAATLGATVATTSLTSFADFESQMSTVKSLMSGSCETTAELEQATAKLSDKAQELGATTAFTSTEVGKAMEYMAMAGWSTDEVLSSVSGVMNLAAASGEDLATVSDIVTDSMTAFGLAADGEFSDGVSNATHYADVLAAASTNANTNVGLMGETFKYVAPIAGTLGYSAEDTAVAVGLMANAGIKGSQAGTSLKTALANLASPTDKQAAAMEQLGISLTDTNGETKSLMDVMGNLRSAIGGTDVALTDADGNLRSYEDIIADVSKTTDGLSKVQQIEAASTIFGKEAMAGMLSIINASDEDFAKLSDAIYNCNGAAEQMAQIKLDNLKGDFVLLSSAADGVSNSLGDKLSPAAREAVQGLTEVLNTLNESGFQAALESVSGQIDQLAGTIQKKLPQLLPMLLGGFNSLFVTLVQSIGTLLPPLMETVLPTLVTAFLALLSQLLSYLQSALPTILESVLSVLEQVGSEIQQQAPVLLQAVMALLQQVVSFVTTNLPEFISAAITLITGFAEGLLQALPEVLRSAQQLVGGLIRGFLKALPQIMQSAVQLVQSLSDGLLQQLPSLLQTAVQLVLNLANGLMRNAPKLIHTALVLINQLIQGLLQCLPQIIQAAIQLIQGLVNGLLQNLPTLIQASVQLIMGLINGLLSALPQLITCAANLIAGLVSGLIQAIPQLIAAIPQLVGALIDGILATDWIGLGASILQAILNGILSIREAIVTSWGEIFSDLFERVKTWATEIWDTAKSALENFLTIIIDKLKELPGEFWNWLTDVLTNVLKWSAEMQNRATEMISNFFSNIVQQLSQLPGEVWNWLLSVIAKVLAWSTEMQNKAWDAVSGFFRTISDKLSDLPGEVWSWLSNVLGRVGSFVSEMGYKAMDAAANLWNNLINGISGLPGEVYSIGSDIVYGIWNGISDVCGWLWGQLSGFCQEIWDNIAGFFGIASPSKLFKKELGFNLVYGLAEGVDDKVKTAVDAVNSLGQSVMTAAQKSLSVNPDVGSMETAPQSGTVVNNYYNNDNSRTINQTNNSPKALTRLEIYRQTRNAINV